MVTALLKMVLLFFYVTYYYLYFLLLVKTSIYFPTFHCSDLSLGVSTGELLWRRGRV